MFFYVNSNKKRESGGGGFRGVMYMISAHQPSSLSASILTAGTTATVAMLRDGVELVVGSAGDSRALLCRKGRARKLTTDHTPDRKDERHRYAPTQLLLPWLPSPAVCGLTSRINLSVPNPLRHRSYTHKQVCPIKLLYCYIIIVLFISFPSAEGLNIQHVVRVECDSGPV